MATITKFNICEQSCKKFVFTELTGDYDSVTNPTGWSTPNIDISDVLTSTLSIYKPNNTSPIIINLFPTYPTIDNTIEFEIDETILGSTISDGLYKFVYTITYTDSNNQIATISQTVYHAVYCNIKCCVDKLFAAIEDFDCGDCMKYQIEKALNAQVLFVSMINSAKCGRYIAFNNQLLMLQRMCNNKCCN
jgi:hypothetical protein